ncbi:MAG: class I SAM-dependent methyltransferase [Novosphingobium sp.]|nr:class I SAM-dependent methyltransferase [Novosphingobium sp.]
MIGSDAFAIAADDELPALTPRQEREFAYHRARAATLDGLAEKPVATDVLSEVRRRPWNAYWSLYDRIIAASPAGKRVLVPGSGFGDDAIRLALLGARVSAFDLSPESVAIARERAERAGCEIDFRVAPAEALAAYDDGTFDMVVFVDILHHVEIAATLREVVRVTRDGGLVLGDELYTHSLLQRVRESVPIARVAYPLLRRWIYGRGEPYITPDEHKIDEAELALVLGALEAPQLEWFGLVEGRLFPSRMVWASRVDRAAMRIAGRAAARLASRVVFSGTIRASAV